MGKAVFGKFNVLFKSNGLGIESRLQDSRVVGLASRTRVLIV